MERIKEKSLRLAKEAALLKELPKPWREGDSGFWFEAILLVKKANLDQSYILAERDGRGIIHYKKDFGRMSPILGIVGIYPYMFIDTAKIENLTTDKAKRKALEEFYPDYMPYAVRANAAKAKGEELDAILRDGAIHLQRLSRPVDVAANKREEEVYSGFTVSDVEKMEDFGSLRVLGERKKKPKELTWYQKQVLQYKEKEDEE